MPIVCTATPIPGQTVSTGQTARPAEPPDDSAVFSGNARLNDTAIKTQATANLAIARVDQAISRVDQELAVYGSVMNRLIFAADHTLTTALEIQQSRSRIQDSDYGSIAAELARTQIIQQAGMAMLTQANQSSQSVLSLLR